MSKKTTDADVQATEIEQASAPSGVAWDVSEMQTAFANVVNIQSTLEQLDIFFGVNESWSEGGDNPSIKISLSNRVILGPHAAKRFLLAFKGVMDEYEARHGELKVDGPNG